MTSLHFAPTSRYNLEAVNNLFQARCENREETQAEVEPDLIKAENEANNSLKSCYEVLDGWFHQF